MQFLISPSPPQETKRKFHTLVSLAPLFLFDASPGLKSRDRQHTAPLGPDSFADFQIPGTNLKDHNLILSCLPSQPINGTLASVLQHPEFCRTPPSTHTPRPPNLPWALRETDQPEEQRVRLSKGVSEQKREIRDQVLLLSLVSYVTLDKLLPLSGLWFPHP